MFFVKEMDREKEKKCRVRLDGSGVDGLVLDRAKRRE